MYVYARGNGAYYFLFDFSTEMKVLSEAEIVRGDRGERGDVMATAAAVGEDPTNGTEEKSKQGNDVSD